jgi:rubrerythrin
MTLHTASEVISLARKLELEAATFYEGLLRFGEAEEVLRGFTAENRRNVAQVERAYYGVISDALEGGFAFDIEEGDYAIKLPESATLRDGLKAMAEVEGRIAQFYATAAQQSQSLLADVPRVFKAIAQKKKARIEKLESMLSSTP